LDGCEVFLIASALDLLGIEEEALGTGFERGFVRAEEVED